MATDGVKLGRAWEEDFNGVAHDLLLGRRLKKPAKAPKRQSSWSGAAVGPRQPPEYPGRGSKDDLRRRLAGVARKSQQVVVKIPKQGRKTAKSLTQHLRYLSRDYEEPMQDESGREIVGKEATRDLEWAWKQTGPALSDESGRTEALHIIFSMREGTDERAVNAAVRATAELEFSGHQWLMVQHHDEPQVHVHVCVKVEALDGTRLNPRKADLQRWRERFAYELRERGVEAEALRRAPRLQREKINTPWSAAQMQARGLATNPPPATPHTESASRWNRSQNAVEQYYDGLIASLAMSTDPSDRVLASDLQRTVLAASVRNRTTDRARPAHKPPQLERG